MIKDKLITVRVTSEQLALIKSIKSNYLKQGIKVNSSQIVRDVLLNLERV